MILANYAQQNRSTIRELGVAFTNPLAQFKAAHFASLTTPDDASNSLNRTAFNHGYNTEYAWWPAMKSGGIASTLNIEGAGALSSDALAVKLAEASITGNGQLTALGSLIVQAVADLTASGTISAANLQAFLAAAANVTGTGSVTANLAALGALLSGVTGSGTATGSILTAIGELEADLVVTGTGLSTANVGQAVWQYLIEAGFTAEQVLRIIAAVTAGKSSGGPDTPTFRNLGDSTDIVSGVANSSGDRTSATYTPG